MKPHRGDTVCVTPGLSWGREEGSAGTGVTPPALAAGLETKLEEVYNQTMLVRVYILQHLLEL